MTFTGCVASIGGYASTITYFIGIIFNFYQSFMFESSLIKRLYTEKKSNKD